MIHHQNESQRQSDHEPLTRKLSELPVDRADDEERPWLEDPAYGVGEFRQGLWSRTTVEVAVRVDVPSGR